MNWLMNKDWRDTLKRYRWIKKAGLLNPTLHDARMAAWRIRQEFTKDELAKEIEKCANDIMGVVREAALKWVLERY